MDKIIYKKLIKLIKKASKNDEVPVGAMIVRNNKIIAKKYNKREHTNSVLGHAEIECIKKAAKKIKKWKLDDCDLYVTLKPCSMCMEIIRESRIRKVFYFVDKPEYKKEYNKINLIKISDEYYENIIKKEMNDFFKKKRK